MNRTTATLLSIGVSAVLIAAGVWALYHHSLGLWPGNSRWTMGRHGMMGGGMGIVMIIFWVIVIAAVVLLISGAFKGINSAKKRLDDPQNPIEILKQRYARGEIDKAEFDAMRNDLIT